MSILTLQLEGGNAKQGPPLGPALGGKGIKAKDVCDQFNARTQDRKGQILTLILDINEEAKTFNMIIKGTPAVLLLKKAANIQKGSAEPNRKKVASITRKKLAEIAAAKQEDLNAFDAEAALKILAGTARSMGITIIND